MDLVAEIATVMSAVGKRQPSLMQSNDVRRFVNFMIEEAKRVPKPPAEPREPAPIDILDV